MAPDEEGGGEQAAKRASKEILQEEIREGRKSMKGTTLALFISGVSAGLDIGFSPLLQAIVRTRCAGYYDHATIEILAANAYAIGFLFVVLGRSELFTEQTTLAVLPVLSGDSPLRALVRQWIVVFLANIAGGAAFAALSMAVVPSLGILDAQILRQMAREHVDRPAAILFGSAVLAGWLMGLLSWLVAAGRETVSQILIVWIVAAVIGFANLNHVIVGGIQLLMAIFGSQGITVADLGRFLLLAALGNIVGGSVFVALVKYGHIAWASADEEVGE